MVWQVRFHIEKRCCGSEVIASQSWKSSKKWMCESGWVMWRWCTLNPATIRKQLLGEHHHIPFQLHTQRKHESFNGCRFCAPAKCTPKVRQLVHSGGWGDARLPFREFFDSSCTKLNKCQWHHFECAQEETAAFLCVFMKGEQKKSGKIACFGGAQKQPCGLCCATAVS